MSGVNQASSVPRALIHKKILEIAEDDPDAALQEIAEAVSGANVELIERVLEEYGDPGMSSQHQGNDAEEPPQGNGFGIDIQGLSDLQLDTLRAIYKHPTASQRDLADMFDNSKSTINQRVNSIDGFEWSNRESIVKSIFEPDTAPDGDASAADEPTATAGKSTSWDGPDGSSDGGPETADRLGQAAESTPTAPVPSTNGDGPADGDTATTDDSAADGDRQAMVDAESVADITERLDAIEEQLATSPAAAGVLGDPELVHKVVHACLSSETITEEEELRIIEQAIGDSGTER